MTITAQRNDVKSKIKSTGILNINHSYVNNNDNNNSNNNMNINNKVWIQYKVEKKA